MPVKKRLGLKSAKKDKENSNATAHAGSSNTVLDDDNISLISAQSHSHDTSTTNTSINDNNIGVRSRNLGKFRLSRTNDRVFSRRHLSRSPSPSRKMLAAEIAVAAAAREAKGPVAPEPPPPPLEQTPLLMMRFTAKATPELIRLVEDRLRQSGLIIYDTVTSQQEPLFTYLYITAATEALETFAEQIRWMKRTNDTHVVEYFTVATKRQFTAAKTTTTTKKQTQRSLPTLASAEPKVLPGLGGDDLFTSNEWCHLTFRLLDSVEVWSETIRVSPKHNDGGLQELNLINMLQEENTVPPELSTSPLHRSSTMAASRSSSGPLRALRRTGSNDSAVSLQGSSSRRLRHLCRDDEEEESTTTTMAAADNRRRPRRGVMRRTSSMGNSTRDLTSTPMGNNGNRPTFAFPKRQFMHRQESVTLERGSATRRSSCLRHVLEANDYVDVVTPIHWGPARDAIVQKTLQSRHIVPPVQEIRNYYGEDVAFYFAWMGHLASWLVVLGGMGLATQVFRYVREDTVDEDEYTPFYGLFTFLWGVLFLRFWRRHEHRLAYRWGTYSLSLYDKQKALTLRPEFTGVPRISPITGEYETYYPAHKRRIQYGISAVVTCVMLSIAFCMMILSLNMQGYIHPERNPERWNADNHHPFHYPGFAVLSEKGELFDMTHRWKSFIPTLIHVAMIFTLNSVYRVIAEVLTERENHETEASFRDSLILKRFLFEAFDCYVALFYLAFYERDVNRLHMELKTVFNIDTFRRLASECFIPYLVQKVHKWTGSATHKKQKQTITGRKKTKEEGEEIDLSMPPKGTDSRDSVLASSETDTLGGSNIDTSVSRFTSRKPHGIGHPSVEELADEADKDEYVSHSVGSTL